MVIEFVGIRIRFLFPTKVNLPPNIYPFLCEEENGLDVDAQYEIKLLEKPLKLLAEKEASYKGIDVYPWKDGRLRVFLPLREDDGCQVACFTNEKQKNVLYYPAKKWKHYSKELHLLHLIGMESLLLKKEALILHSSLVEKDGYAILFSGPSGAGKSTQATLWQEYLGAHILNGDRSVIRKENGVFWGAGSPWAGSSEVYEKKQAPLKGIFILKQLSENKIRRLKAEAFVKIYQQTIVNAWDEKFVIQLSDLIAELLEQVPVYELSCRPDEQAVMLAYKTLFEGDI